MKRKKAPTLGIGITEDNPNYRSSALSPLRKAGKILIDSQNNTATPYLQHNDINDPRFLAYDNLRRQALQHQSEVQRQLLPAFVNYHVKNSNFSGITFKNSLPGNADGYTRDSTNNGAHEILMNMKGPRAMLPILNHEFMHLTNRLKTNPTERSENVLPARIDNLLPKPQDPGGTRGDRLTALQKSERAKLFGKTQGLVNRGQPEFNNAYRYPFF